MDDFDCTRRQSPWMSIPEGERYCRVRSGALRSAVYRGEVPGYRREGGCGALVNVRDLDEWVRSWPLARLTLPGAQV